MHQTLHIFRKDLRHFWPEALTCLLVTAIFARIYPAQWSPQPEGIGLFIGRVALPPASLQTAANIVGTLLPLSWFVLIIRVIQDECLVGERPYWYTRPIRWPRLLAAKSLFLFLFLWLPFAAAQFALMIEAGFHPTLEMPRYLLFVVASLAAFTLPIVCVATITRNFFRAVLTTLGLIILVIVMALFVTEGPFSTHITTPYSDLISFPLFLTVLLSCIVSQYSTRRTWLARTMIGALIPTLLLFGINPVEATLLERHYYPLVPNAIPVDISLATEPGSDGKPPELRIGSAESKKFVSLTVPLAISGVPYGYAVLPDNVRLRIIAADGSSWTSPWHVLYNRSYRPATRSGQVSFDVDHAFFERIRPRPAALELSFALTEVEAGDPVRTAVPLDDRELTLPGVGLCNLSAKPTGNNVTLTCRHAFADPQQTLVTAFLSGDPCPDSPNLPRRSAPATATTGSLNPDPLEVFLSAIHDSNLSLGFQQDTDTETSYGGYLCPGTPITLTQYRAVRRAQYRFNTEHPAARNLRSDAQAVSLHPHKAVSNSKRPRTRAGSYPLLCNEPNLFRKNRAPRNILFIRVNPVGRPLGALHRFLIQMTLVRLVPRRFHCFVRRPSRSLGCV